MNENLDLTKILKNAPKGIRLWSPICGVCELFTVNVDFGAFPIVCIGIDDGLEWHFKANGAFTNNTGVECLLFPSMENRDWSTFKVPKKHKHFEPFQKVLCVADNNHDCEVWSADFYSHYDEFTFEHYLVSGFVKADDEVIPYEGNEDKLGKTVEGIK
jgi:hypothetical protein